MARTAYNVRVEYSGTDSLAVYPFSFKIEALSHLLIIHYTNAGVELARMRGNALSSPVTHVTYDADLGGGTVHLVGNLASGQKLAFLLANDEPVQLSEFRNKFDFTLKRIEAALDYGLGAIQRLTYIGKRSVKLHDLDDVGAFDPTLPAGMAGQDDLIPLTNSDGTGWAPVSQWIPKPDVWTASGAADAAADSAADAAAYAAAAALSAAGADASELAAANHAANALNSANSASTSLGSIGTAVTLAQDAANDATIAKDAAEAAEANVAADAASAAASAVAAAASEANVAADAADAASAAAAADASADAAAASAALAASIPDQTGNAGKYLSTNGTVTSWEDVVGGGGAGAGFEVHANDAAYVTANGAAQAGDAFFSLATNGVRVYNGALAAWQGLANNNLSNLLPTTINTNLIPDTNVTHDLGDATHAFDRGYIDRIDGSAVYTQVLESMTFKCDSLNMPDGVDGPGTKFTFPNLYTENTSGAPSLDLNVLTGNATGNTSGKIKIKTGSATNRGILELDGYYIRVIGTGVEPTGTSGGLYYNSTTNKFRYHNGTAWGDFLYSDDTTFAKLLGRASGQILIGGTGSGENLLLQSTSHATKGKIQFGATAATHFDEVNGRIGVAVSSAGTRLDINGDFNTRMVGTGQVTTAGANVIPSVAGISHLQVTAATSIAGLNGVVNGKFVYLHNVNTVPCVLLNENTAATTANQRIITGTGGDVAIPANASASFIWDSVTARWRVLSITGNPIVSSKTAAYTALTSDEVLLCSAASGAYTVTLPTAVGISGKRLTIKKTDSSVNAVTLDAASTETIDGSLTFALEVQHEAVTIVSDGANWFII